jgi:hypothetical protein
MRLFRPAYLPLLCLLPLLPARSARSEEKKFGKVDPSVLAMTVYPDDTTAAAVKLFDVGEMHVSESGGISMELKRHFRIKILKPAGLPQADVVLRFWHEDRIFDIDAVSISPSGAKTKLQAKSIHEEMFGKKIRRKTFAVPGVEVGSVVDVRYSLNSEHVIQLDPWIFQDDIPTLESSILLSIDPGYLYNVVIRNDPKRRVIPTEESYIDSNHPGKNLIRYLYRAEKLPAVKEEPYVACLDNYRARIDFQIVGFQDADVNFRFIKDLKTLCRELTDGRVGRFLDPTNRIQSMVKKSVRPGDNETAIIRRLFEEARDGFEPDPVFEYFYPEREPDEILDQRKATVSERNLLLVSMLRAAGLDAKPVLISTRGNGKADPEVPLLTQFDRIVATAPMGSRFWFLDAGHRFLPFGQIPDEDLSNVGLQVTRDKYEFLLIPNNGLKRVEKIEARLSPRPAPGGEEEWTGKGRWTGTGYASEDANEGLDEKKNARLWLESRYSKKVDGFRISSADTLRKPAAADSFMTDFGFALDPPLEAIGGEWAVRPFPFTGFRENPFQSEQRDFPVEFGFLSSKSERTVFEFPTGTVLVSLPADRIVGNEHVVMMRRFSVLGDSPLAVSCERSFTVKTVTVPESRYPELRNLYSQMVDADREPVLVRPPAGSKR